MTTKARCRSQRSHGTYWAYSKYGCRCLPALLDESRYRRHLRSGKPTGLVSDATGASRIAQGLAVYGYTVDQIAAAAGVSDRLVAHLQAGKSTIRTSKDRALRAAADKLFAAPPPVGWSASRARSAARRNGWAPLAAWDDDTIDDPTAQPNLGGDTDEQAGYDPITVAFAVDGRLTYEQLNAHRPDLIETIRRLAQTMTDVEIAHHLRWPGASNGPAGKTSGQNSVGKLRGRENIPGPDRYQTVYAYRPGGRRARNDKAA